MLVQLLQLVQAGEIDGLVFAAVHGDDKGTVCAMGQINPILLAEMFDQMYSEVCGDPVQPTHEYMGDMLQ